MSVKKEIREILVEHNYFKDINDKIQNDLLNLFDEVYVLIIHFNEGDIPHTEFEGVYLNEIDAENRGNTINFNNGKLNRGRTSHDDPFWIEPNQIAFSIIKTKLN